MTIWEQTATRIELPLLKLSSPTMPNKVGCQSVT
jgi:hypothetical protein